MENYGHIEQIHHRLDKQDELLRDIHERLIDHIAREDEIKPALDDIAALWRGSKIIIPILAATATGLASAWAWTKGHIHL